MVDAEKDFQQLLDEGVIIQMGWNWPYQVDVSKLNHRLFALASEVEEAKLFGEG